MLPWTADELVTCWKLGCASNKLFDKREGPHWEMANDVRAELGVDALMQSGKKRFFGVG